MRERQLSRVWSREKISPLWSLPYASGKNGSTVVVLESCDRERGREVRDSSPYHENSSQRLLPQRR